MTDRPQISVDARSSVWDEPPWPSAFELARILPSGSWTLIGGLMVKLHAELAGLPASRSTVDVDCTLHLETRAVTFAEAAHRLGAAGYVLNRDTRFAYRFDRGDDRVDVMCSDRHAAWMRPRFDGRPLFGVPGGSRALQQTINVDFQTRQGGARLIVPSIRGALVLKGAAYLEDSRDSGRHAEDAVVLLACATSPEETLAGLSQRSRRRVRALTKELSEHAGPWASHDAIVQALARESLEGMVPLLHQ